MENKEETEDAVIVFAPPHVAMSELVLLEISRADFDGRAILIGDRAALVAAANRHESFLDDLPDPPTMTAESTDSGKITKIQNHKRHIKKKNKRRK